ncbi:thiol-disulfide oxidoreductase DCC family protein [Nitrospira sp. M1]
MEEVKSTGQPLDDYSRVILFDGVCNFCNATVDFVIRRDPQRKFMFGTLQSEPGQQILRRNNFDTQDFETFLYLENGQVFTKSTAALRVAKELTGMWPLLYVCIVIPQVIRDLVYQFIGRRRYQWMGKRESCRLPDESERARFV